MRDNNEYVRALLGLYGKSLMLDDTSALSPGAEVPLRLRVRPPRLHARATLGNDASPKNIMAMGIRWRVDEEKKNDRPLFRGFVNWLKEAHPDRFERLPTAWRAVYDDEDPAGYRSFRLVLDPDSRSALPVGFFTMAIDEVFENEFLKSLYEETGRSPGSSRRTAPVGAHDGRRPHCGRTDCVPLREPAGETRDCAEYVRDRLEALGLETVVAGETAGRANVVANGCDADFLLCGHLDVVPALGETWSFDPFGGAVRDGFVLGRGATDMKGGCAALIGPSATRSSAARHRRIASPSSATRRPGAAASGTCSARGSSPPATA